MSCKQSISLIRGLIATIIILQSGFASFEELDVPYVVQESYYCAPACLAMIRLYWGETVTQYSIANKSGWSKKQGLTVAKLRAYLDTLESYNYQIGSGNIMLLKEFIKRGYPVVIALSGSKNEIQHAVVLTGFNDKFFFYHDPARGETLRATFSKIAARWESSDFFYCLLFPQ